MSTSFRHILLSSMFSSVSDILVNKDLQSLITVYKV